MVLTNNSDHPGYNVRESSDPDDAHEERNWEPRLEAGVFTIRDGK